MALRLSTGSRNKFNATGSVKSVMADGYIDFYAGSQPATADAVETGTLLGTVTLASGAFTPGVATNGINMDLSTAGVLAKSVSEVWSFDGLAAASTGTVAGWFRWRENADTRGASTSFARIDGSIGTSSAYQMEMSNAVIVEDVSTIINSFTFAIPAS